MDGWIDGWMERLLLYRLNILDSRPLSLLACLVVGGLFLLNGCFVCVFVLDLSMVFSFLIVALCVYLYLIGRWSS